MSFEVSRWGRQTLAFNAGKVLLQSGASENAPSLFTYASATDTVDTIIADNYFAPVIFDLSLADIIYISGSDNASFYYVSSITRSTGQVSVSAVTTPPDITLPDGEILIGNASSVATPGNLVAGIGISIGHVGNDLTVTATAGGVGWTVVTGLSQQMDVDSGYISNNAVPVELILPVLSSVGSEIDIMGLGAGGWVVAQNASQVIHIGSASTSAGVGGSIESTNRYDSLTLICTVANTTWNVLGAPQGIITVA